MIREQLTVSVEMYLKTSITKFKMFVIQYENKRGDQCEADFHELKTCLTHILYDERISSSPCIHIKKVSKYWKTSFSLDTLCDEELTSDEINDIELLKSKVKNVVTYSYGIK